MSFVGGCVVCGLLDIIRGSPTFCCESLKLLKGMYLVFVSSVYTLEYVVAEFRYVQCTMYSTSTLISNHIFMHCKCISEMPRSKYRSSRITLGTAPELMCNNTYGKSQYGLPRVLEFQLFGLFEIVTNMSLVHSALYKTKYAPREYVL